MSRNSVSPHFSFSNSKRSLTSPCWKCVSRSSDQRRGREDILQYPQQHYNSDLRRCREDLLQPLWRERGQAQRKLYNDGRVILWVRFDGFANDVPRLQSRRRMAAQPFQGRWPEQFQKEIRESIYLVLDTADNRGLDSLRDRLNLVRYLSRGIEISVREAA